MCLFSSTQKLTKVESFLMCSYRKSFVSSVLEDADQNARHLLELIKNRAFFCSVFLINEIPHPH